MNFNISKMVCTPLAPIKHIICSAKFYITFVFHFSWVLQPSEEKLKTILMQNQGGGGQIRCIMGDVQVVYSYHSNIQFTQAIHTFNSDRNRHNSPSIPRSPGGYSLQQSIQGGSARKGHIKEQGIHKLNYVKALENLSFKY